MFDRILVLGPHTDDGEFGCGASISRFIEEGKEVYYATFSCAERSVPEGYPEDILEREVKQASQVLGIDKEHLKIYRYPVREFAHYRQDILEDLVQLNRDLDPDLVMMPSTHDLHQDHHTVAMEGMRAFKFKSILGYEMPWNNVTFSTTSFVHLDERHVMKKLESLKCYRSQIGRKYADPEYIKGLAMTRGVQIGVDYAETFDAIRWIIR